MWCKLRLILSRRVALGKNSLPNHTSRGSRATLRHKPNGYHIRALALPRLTAERAHRREKPNGLLVISLCVASRLSDSCDSRSTSLSSVRLSVRFYIWFPPLALGRIKSQTFCNCPWDWTWRFHHGKKLKWNEWHILVHGNDICGVQGQPAWAPSNFGMRDLGICMSLYVWCL